MATDSFVVQPVVVNLAAVSVEEILPGAIVWELKRGKVQHHHKTLQNAAVVCAPAMKDGDILQLINSITLGIEGPTSFVVWLRIEILAAQVC